MNDVAYEEHGCVSIIYHFIRASCIYISCRESESSCRGANSWVFDESCEVNFFLEIIY